VYGGGIRAVLEAVRDGRAEEGVLFHCTGKFKRVFAWCWEKFIFFSSFSSFCLVLVLADMVTAGRDRTGVVAGLLLSLAGASPETIALDFILSRIGTEPAREQLLAFALKGSMAEDVHAPGFHNLCNLRISCWEAFVKAAESEYAGFEGYVTRTLGFSETDVAKIKANLVLPN
jgi:hypothetical protein